MSVAAVDAVLRANLSPASIKLMALVVAWHFNDEKGRAWAGLGTMAREACMSERHAKRALCALKSAGVLVVARATAGGDRYATTTHYAFDMQLLEQLSNPVRQRTGGAGAPGSDADAGRDKPQAQEGLPRAPAAPHPVRWRPGPRAPAAPKRDERKPTASLSSKEPAAPDSAGGRSAGASDSSASSKVVKMSTIRQQPAWDGEVVRRRHLAAAIAEPVPSWLGDDALLSAMGVRFGEGTLADNRQQGQTKNEYIRLVLGARAAAIKELKAAKRRTVKPAASASVVVSERR